MTNRLNITTSWTDGSICERSKRRIIQEHNNNNKDNKDNKEPNEPNEPKEKGMMRKSEALCESFDNRIMSNCETIQSRDTNNRREDNCIKMAGREMFNKINQNPFLLGNDYVSDIITQDQYLKPTATYLNHD